MSLKNEDRLSVVKYRIEKAYERIEDAKVAIDYKRWNMAANRLYYAFYEAATALLLANEIATKTHRGLLTMISAHFVMSGKLSIEEGKLGRTLFNMRNEDDYQDFVDATEEEIKDLLPQTKALIDKLISLNKLATDFKQTDLI